MIIHIFRVRSTQSCFKQGIGTLRGEQTTPPRDIPQLSRKLLYLYAPTVLTPILPSPELATVREIRVGTMTDSTRWKATVYVGGLASLATTANIHDAFIPFGEITDISLPKNDAPNATEPHRGFAYVEYEDAEDAKEAIDNMDQSEFFGRILKVSAAKAPKSAEEGLGSKTAVWEQVRLPFYS